MQDLNDLYYFAMVVEHGGFAAAERALGIPKSRLSRRIAQLETDMGVRLLQRSTRRFAVTEVGQSVQRHAQAMLSEAQSAREAVDRLSVEPRGVIKVSCPVSLAQRQLACLLPEFLERHPQVQNVICGHVHRKIVTRIGNAICSTAPSIGHQVAFDFRNGAEGGLVFEPPAFDLHWVRPDGGMVSHTVYIERFPGPYPFALDPDYPGAH